MKLCECGCGQEVTREGNRFLNGHNVRVSHPLKNTESVKKMRESVSSIDAREKKREMMLGLWKDTEFVRKRLEVIRSPESIKKNRETILSLWQDPTYSQHVFEGRNITPNQVELQLQELFTSLGLPYKFVGNGEVIIGGKSPDFIDTNGQKKIIEHFGDYWHSEEVKGHSIEKEVSDRIEHFLQFGFKTLIIWERELSNIGTLSQKILKFDATL